MSGGLLVCTEFFPHSNQAHEGQFVFDQLHYLPAFPAVTVVAPAPRYPPLPRYRYLRRMGAPAGRFDGPGFACFRVQVPVAGRWAERLSIAAFLSRVRPIVNELNPAPALIHGHWAYRSGYVAGVIARERRLPFVLTLHGSDINVWIRERCKRARILRALQAADAVIALSGAMRQAVLRENVAAEKIFIVPQAVDLALFRPRASRLAPRRRERFGRRFVFLCAANFYAGKGQDILLEALRGLNGQLGVIFVGAGPQQQRLQIRARRLGLAGAVWFAGRQAHSEMPEWMNAVDALVLPSLREGLPAVALEAMACGKPVVATAVGGLPEVIRPELTGMLVPPSNAGALRAALERTAMQPWDAAAIRAACSAYSWPAFRNRMSEVYAFARQKFAAPGC